MYVIAVSCGLIQWSVLLQPISLQCAQSKSSPKAATADQGGGLIAAISAVTGAMYQWVQGVFDTVLEFYNANKKYLTYKKTKQFLKTSAFDMHKELWTKMTWKRIQRYGKFMIKVHSPSRLQKDKKVTYFDALFGCC